MTLCPEEITLLMEKGCVKLIYGRSLLDSPSAEIKNKFCDQETEFCKSQRELYLKKKEAGVKMKVGTVKKDKEEKDDKFSSRTIDQSKMISLEVKKKQNLVVDSNMALIATSDPWITESELEEVEWFYPSTDSERLKYRVFKDLWEKDYYITSGAKFGGDYLCYIGDPRKFHASFIVICKDHNEKFSCKDLIVFGRIGTHTKKTAILASECNGNISYQSLQWMERTKI